MIINKKSGRKFRILIFLVFFLIAFIYVPIGSNLLFQGKKDDESVGDYHNLNLSAQEINVTTPENITYTEPMNGYYPGSYGFESDDSGSSPPGWSLFGSGGTIDVISEMGGHNKVLEFHDTSGSGFRAAEQNLGANRNTNGDTIEFWWRTTNSLNTFGVAILNEGKTGILTEVRIMDGYFKYDTGGGYQNFIVCDNNKWYHHRIVIDFTNKEFDWFIDGTNDQLNIAFYNTSVTNMRSIYMGTSYSQSAYYNYIDAIGYSWDSTYDIGDNLNEGILLSYDKAFSADWMGYSLDGQANKTILGNTTLPMPSDGHHAIQVFGNNTMGEVFESDIRYFSVKSINIITPENKTYTKPMSGYYPATYGFENDIVNSVPLGWTDESGGPTWCKVIASEDGHNNVLQLYDTTGGDPYAINAIGTKESGTVEFWMKNVNMNEKAYFAPRSGTTQLFRVVLADNTARVTAQGSTDYGLAVAAADTWHHFSVDFECGTGAYKGLGQYEFYVTYGGIRYGPYNFWNNAPNTENIAFSGFYGSGNYYYVDAVGYSWDPAYNVGDNMGEGLLLSYDKTFSADWMGYSLDDQANKTIVGNTTIQMPLNGHHTIQVFGNNTMSEVFESDIRYFSVKSINIITPENKTYTKPMSGYYPATYGFENDIVGDDPYGWSVTEPGLQSVQVISSLDGHNNVLELFDTESGAGAQTYVNNSFSPQTSGTIEFWYRTSGFLEDQTLRTEYNLDISIYFGVSSGNFQYYNTSGWQVLVPHNNDQWYHIRFDFDCASDTYDFYLNGILIQSNLEFYTAVSSLDKILFLTRQWGTSSDFYSYVDALGYSWDPNYSTGDNLNEGLLLSYENSTTLDWQGFSLDGQANKTILGNTTFPIPSPGHHTIQVFGNNTMSEVFESDIRHFSVKSINIITPENETYTDPMSGYYPGTYGFENDVIGSNPTDWIVDEAGGIINVISLEDGHNNVLEMDDTSATLSTEVYQNFTEQTTGTIEFWAKFSDTSTDRAYTLRINDEGTAHGIYMTVAYGKLRRHPTIPAIDICDLNSDQWYHLRIEFDTSTDWHLWIDSVSQDGGSGYGYWETPIALDQINFYTPSIADNKKIFLDTFGYSWDPAYNVGDNLGEGLLLSYDKTFSAEWMGYSLDDQANRTILGNITIPFPSNGHHTIQVFGNNSIGEMFESDKIHFTVEHISIDVISPENKTYTEPMNGYYPASYSFEYDVIGSDPMDWSVYEVGGTVNVIDSLGNHNRVVEVHSTSGDHARLTNTFSATAIGTIECWVRTNTIIDDSIVLRATDGPSTDEFLISVNSGTNKWEYNDGGTWYDMTADVTVNTWYHFMIEFDCADDWHVWIDGVSQDGGTGFGYRNPPSQMDRFIIGTTNQPTDCYAYFDAIGYSWDPNYYIGDNLNEGLLLSYTNSSALTWMGYSLDGQANKTILGNTTIPLPVSGHHTIQVFGNSLLGFNYESDIRHFSISLEDIIIDLLTPENIIYTNPMSGYYPGTYGFEDELVGTTGLSIGFLDTYEASTNCYITVMSELGAHKNILHVYDNNAGTGLRTQFFNYFGNKGSGSIEFWIRTTDATLASHVRVYSSTDDYMIQFKIEDDRIQTNDVATWANLVNPAANNQWYHIRFDLESTTGGYQGLNQYEYYVYVDGVRFGAFGFQNNVIPYKLFIGTLGTDGGYSTYYDAIGYSWDSDYTIGDNSEEGLLLSYTNSSALEWIGYSLDGQSNKTIAGNKVIPMPGNGLHTIQIHGRSTYGHYYASSLVYFTVDISEAPPPPPNGDNFMLIIILISVFSLVGITIAIVVYKKVHTPSKEPKPRKPKVKKTKPKKKGIIEEEVFCPFCNTPITPQHKFCTYCGSDLVEDEESKI